MKHRIFRMAALFFAAVMLASGLGLASELWRYRQGRQAYEELARYARTESPPPEAEGPEEEPAETAGSGLAKSGGGLTVDFEALKEINPDTAAWIYGPDTGISYPVVLGGDNDYYLTHLFDGAENRSGCPFLDFRTSPDLSDPHIVIYGHHMRDGSMFTPLKYYRDQAYYESHPEFALLTPDSAFTMEIFSIYVADDQADAWQLTFSGEDQREAWLAGLEDKSMIRCQAGADPEAQTLTLSTCTYEFENARLVVHGNLRPR